MTVSVIRSTRFAAAGRTTIGVRPASIIRSPSANTASSHTRCDIITHCHERRAGVIAVAARRTAAFVTFIIRGTSTDAVAGLWDGELCWDLCSLTCSPSSSRLCAETVACTVQRCYCRHPLSGQVSMAACVHRVKAPAVFICQDAFIIQAVASSRITIVLVAH